MKRKIFILSFICIFFTGFVNAQNGLESIIVEKYYVSNVVDATGSIGVLPVGSVTYRIYADMLPGFKFQAAYGVPGHSLLISSTTSFFNNEDRGATTPTYNKTQARGNSVMLDSWLSVGAGCVGNLGFPKSEDDVALGGATVINNSVPPMLQNNDPTAGIPLTTHDGLFTATVQPVTFVGITSVELALFDATSQVGNSFTTSNGSWASLNGSTGPVASTNKVLIAQMTTDGEFHYELNIQIGTPTGGVENYVASNPAGVEITIPSLTGTLGGSNVSPIVNITSPANGASFTSGTVVPITAMAADADGTVSSVEFFVDGASIIIDNTAPYTANYTIVSGTHSLTARATDNTGAQTTSSAISISVTSNPPPTVNITYPANGSLFIAPTVVNITVNAFDPNGTVAQVQFYVNGGLVGSDATVPYSFNWTSVIGSANITAVATDNLGAQTTSAGILVTVADPNIPYKIISSNNICLSNSFCLPVKAISTVNNVIGYDIVMQYNVTKVRPTGVITVSSNLINPTYVDVASSIDSANGIITISLYFNTSAPANTEFNGLGDIFCIEFSKKAAFNPADTASFTISSLQESYISGVSIKPVDPGKYISYKDSTFNGTLKYWLNNIPIKYNAAVPASYLITNIFGSNNSCAVNSATAVQPDTLGNFKYSIWNGQNISIQKDIPGTTSVQPVVNGFDALLTRKILMNDPGFTPSIFQMIAMDVNTDGVVSAGDASQINQRAVLMILEYKQSWNYDSNGVSNGQSSKDWLFIDSVRLSTNLAYRISATFPANDGVGFSKGRVPIVPFCLPLTISNFASCPQITSERYKGVLLGDVDGNYANISPNGMFRKSESEKVILDFTKATFDVNYIDIPVSIISDQDVYALDLSINWNENNYLFHSIINHTNNLSAFSNFNENDKFLRVTSNRLEKYEVGAELMSIRFVKISGADTKIEINQSEGYLNGNRVNVEFRNNSVIANNNIINTVNVYPNPVKGILNIETSLDATIQIFSIDGRQVFNESEIKANSKLEIDSQNLINGIYLIRICNAENVTMRKVVIEN